MHPMKLYQHDAEYNRLAMEIISFGERHDDRTGVGTRSLFGEQMKFDLRKGFPILTTKKVWFKGIVAELLWMLSGSTNVEPLQKQGVHIWDEWAKENGDLGRVYGAQWRDFVGDMDSYGYANTVDQIKNIIKQIREVPNSRRHIVTAWNPAEIEEAALPPCHCFFQFNVKGEYLDCQLYQRSADMFLGVPFNIASYALLTHIVAYVCDLKPRRFIHTFGDVHVYNNHMDQFAEQLKRNSHGPMPWLSLSGPRELVKDDWMGDMLWTPEHIQLHDYQPAPAISAPVAV